MCRHTKLQELTLNDAGVASNWKVRSRYAMLVLSMYERI